MRRLVFALCCSMLCLSACGGGGGGPAGTAGDQDVGPALFTFSGDYHTVGLATDGTVSNTAFFGSVTADALGGLSGVASANQDGMVPPLGPIPYAAGYTVLPDGTLVVESLVGGFGGMSEDRGVAALWSGGMNVWLRRAGTYDLSTLSGIYRFVGKFASSSSTLLSVGGTITFDGVGAGTFMPEFLNNEGSLVGTATDPLTYAVTPAGDVTIDIRGLQTLQGGVGRAGELLVVAGGTATGQDPMVFHCIRQQTGGSLARLDGTYTFVLDRLAQTTHDNRGGFGTLSADGSDTARVTEVLTAGPAVTVPVAVAADGQIDLILDGGYRVRGALSASGDVAFLAGGIDDGFDPGLVSLVRKPVVPAGDDIPLDLFRSAAIAQAPPRGSMLSDRVGPLFSHRRITVGEVSEIATVPGLFIGQGERVLLQFDLSQVQPGRTVARVELVTVQSGVENAPFELGALQVDHVTPFADFPVYGDYDPIRRPLGTLGTLTDQPMVGALSLDVTAAVQGDIADARARTAFLLYFPRQDNDDNDRDRLILDDYAGPGPRPGPRTRLRITYQ